MVKQAEEVLRSLIYFPTLETFSGRKKKQRKKETAKMKELKAALNGTSCFKNYKLRHSRANVVKWKSEKMGRK